MLWTHMLQIFPFQKRQKKGEWIFSFVYFRGNFSVLLHQKTHCSFVVHVQCRAHDKFPLKNPVYMTDNSKATNYRNFMPPAASGIKHSFQPCFYLLNLDKFMLLMTVKKTLRCRNCIPRHKNNLELNILQVLQMKNMDVIKTIKKRWNWFFF